MNFNTLDKAYIGQDDGAEKSYCMWHSQGNKKYLFKYF